MTHIYLSPKASLAEIVHRIASSLARASWPGLRRLTVEARGAAIHLEGNVSTHFEKRQVLQWVRDLAGERAVSERIVVVSRHAKPTYRSAIARQLLPT